jgi:2-C-methyl-D-erythritol 4-phosphate cytidylyltransferase
MKSIAVIVAGGSGSRMGTDRPKQFLELEGKPLLVHSAIAFREAFADIDIVLVLPQVHLDEGMTLMAAHLPDVRVRFTEGGATRYDSVRRGLALVEGPAIVFVHDAVRCLVTASLIRNCYFRAMEKGSAIPAVAVKDSMRMVGDGASRVVDREKLRAVQTPQTFHTDLILPAFAQAYDPSFTDEATVVESSGRSIELIEGEETNIKVTYPTDLIVAEKIMRSRLT